MRMPNSRTVTVNMIFALPVFLGTGRSVAGGTELGVGPVGGGELEPGGRKDIMPLRLVRGRGEAGVPEPCAEQYIFVAGEHGPHVFIKHEQSEITVRSCQNRARTRWILDRVCCRCDVDMYITCV